MKPTNTRKEVRVHHTGKRKHRIRRPNTEIRLLYANANGILTKVESLNIAINNFQPDICSITETKLTTSPPNITNYAWEYKNRNNRNGGGVAQLIKNDLVKNTCRTQNIEDQNQEILWTQIKNGTKKIHIGTYYSPQESANLETIEREYSQLTTQINKLKTTGSIILTGDFNAKLEINNNKVQQKETRNGKHLQELIQETNLTPISTEATHGNWTRVNRNNTSEKSVIDYILISEDLKKQIKEITIDEEGTYRLKGKKDSDHNTIMLTLRTHTSRLVEKVTKWNINDETTWSKYNEQLINSYHDHPPTNYEDFHNILIDTLKSSIGEKHIWAGRSKQREPEKIKELRKLKRVARHEFQQAVKNKSTDLESKLNSYFQVQRDLNKEITENEKQNTLTTMNKLIKEGGCKSTNFWKIRKNILRINTTQDNLITEENTMIENPEEAKNYIANYYEGLYKAREGKPEYQQETEEIKEKYKQIKREMVNLPNEEPFSMQELETVVKQLKRKKSSGPDLLPNEILIEANEQTRIIYLNMFNQILISQAIPKQWQHGEITTIYKGKGTKGKCSNERGITLSSNLGKAFERLINNRIVKQITMTEAQAGGQKGHSTTDHLLILKDTIQHIRNQRKTAYVIVLEVTKAYDKAWIDAILYMANKNGVETKIWNIIRNLNEKLTASIKTKYGLTRTINITDSLRQGGVLSVILYALLMDEINKTIANSDSKPVLKNNANETGCLLWVDDVVLIADNPQDAQKLLDITNKVASTYHIEFGMEKSKVLKIGKKGTSPPLRLGHLNLEYTEKYKYLGETLNTNNSMKNHITTIRSKTEAAYQTILTVAKNPSFQNIELQTIWKLLETCIQPIITYACETWNPTKQEVKEINRIQESIIKRILMTPVTTPTDAIYVETGITSIETITTMRKLNKEAKLKAKPNCKTNKVREENTSKGWNDKLKQTKQLLNINPDTTLKQAKRILDNKTKEDTETKAINKTKMSYLISGKQNWTPGKRSQYMDKLTRLQASTIFKARTRMLDTKLNYKNKYPNKMCRMCNTETETQEHVLQDCKTLHPDNTTKITTNQIFEENTDKLRNTATQIQSIIEQLTAQKTPQTTQ